MPAKRDAFWAAYGGRPAGRDAQWRLQLYRARHLVADLVESARGGHLDHLGKTAAELRSSLPALGG